MERYIPQSSSLGAWAGNLQTAVQTIAGRYVGANPPIGYTFRPFHIGGFMQDAEGFYLLDLAEKFPSLPDGERACAVGAVWSDGGMETEGLVCGAVAVPRIAQRPGDLLRKRGCGVSAGI